MVKHSFPLRVGVLFGGRSGEHEVSLRSAQSVLNALDPQKYLVTQIGITREGEWLIGEDVNGAMLAGDISPLTPATLLPDPSHPGLHILQATNYESRITNNQSPLPLDVLFPVLHGTFGEDGTLQGVFEMADVAYVGCGVLGAALGMDKGVFKDVMRANGIPVVESLTVLRSQVQNDLEGVLAQAEQLAAYPLFVKPANLGSSVGITKCNSRGDLVEGLLEACRFDRRILIERGLNAREIEVSVLGNDTPEASIPGEVLPSREFYSYESKYLDGTSGLLIPAPIETVMAEQVQKWAVQAFRVIDGSGLARVDFLLDKDSGALYLNEVNTMPGFTEISMYPKLWAASGLPYPALLDRLIELALERKADRARNEYHR
jgi:D-alanine-D-alanine ligase